MIISNLQWTDHIDFRLGKSMNALFRLKRNTPSVLSIEGKVYLFLPIITPSLFFALECWDLKRTDGYNLEVQQLRA